jgi:2-dehydropantoate 2-reductase
MRLAVLGGGAMGSLFAGLLAASGTDVTLVDRDPDHVAAAAAGLSVQGATDLSVPVPATTDPAAAVPVDCVLLFVKSYQTAAAVRDAAPLLGGDTHLCTLQNGLGNVEAISEHVPRERILAGATSHGATFLGPGGVRHAGRGETELGRIADTAVANGIDPDGTGRSDAGFDSDSDSARIAERLAARLSAAGVETAVVADPLDAVWRKVLVNVGINAATALARVENGALAERAPGRRLVAAAVNEAAAVARAAGRTPPSDPVERTLAVAETTGANRSSMSQDLAAGRRTEVEALHGAVVGRGERLAVPTPVNRTLADLVRLAQSDDAGRGQS